MGQYSQIYNELFGAGVATSGTGSFGNLYDEMFGSNGMFQPPIEVSEPPVPLQELNRFEQSEPGIMPPMPSTTAPRGPVNDFGPGVMPETPRQWVSTAPNEAAYGASPMVGPRPQEALSQEQYADVFGEIDRIANKYADWGRDGTNAPVFRREGQVQGDAQFNTSMFHADSIEAILNTHGADPLQWTPDVFKKAREAWKPLSAARFQEEKDRRIQLSMGGEQQDRPAGSDYLDYLDTILGTGADTPAESKATERARTLAEWVRKLEKNYVPSINDTPMRYIPVARHLFAAEENKQIRDAAIAIMDPDVEPTGRDYARYARHLVRSQMLAGEDKSSGERILTGIIDTAFQMPGFMFEMGATGGAAPATATAMKAATQGAFKEAAKVGGAALGKSFAGAQRMAVPTQFVSGATRRMIPTLSPATVDNQTDLVVADPGESFEQAALHGYVDAQIEAFSESAGAGVSAPAANLLNRIPVVRAVQSELKNAWLGKVAGRTEAQYAKKVLAAGGLNDVVTELGEEQLGAALRKATGLEEDFGPVEKLFTGNQKERTKAIEELLIQAGAFGALPVTQVAAGLSGSDAVQDRGAVVASRLLAMPDGTPFTAKQALRLAMSDGSRKSFTRILGLDRANVGSSLHRERVVRDATKFVTGVMYQFNDDLQRKMGVQPGDDRVGLPQFPVEPVRDTGTSGAVPQAQQGPPETAQAIQGAQGETFAQPSVTGPQMPAAAAGVTERPPSTAGVELPYEGPQTVFDPQAEKARLMKMDRGELYKLAREYGLTGMSAKRKDIVADAIVDHLTPKRIGEIDETAASPQYDQTGRLVSKAANQLAQPLPKVLKRAVTEGIDPVELQLMVNDVHDEMKAMADNEFTPEQREVRKKYGGVINAMKNHGVDEFKGMDTLYEDMLIAGIDSNADAAEAASQALPTEQFKEWLLREPTEVPPKQSDRVIDQAVERMLVSANAADESTEFPFGGGFGPDSIGAAQTRTGSLGDNEKDVLTSLQVMGVGRPDLQNPGTSSMSRAMIDEMDEDRKREFIAQSHQQWRDEAEKRLTTDMAAEEARLLERHANLEEMGGAEEKIAQQLVDRAMQQAFEPDTLNEADIARAKALHEAHRATRSDLARRLGSARDPVETPKDRAKRIISDALLSGSEGHRGAVDAANDRLKEARNEGNTKEIEAATSELEKLRKQWEDAFVTLKDRLEKSGYDLSQIDTIAEDPVRAQKLMNDIETLTEGKLGNMAYEYWRNSILSAVTTTGADIAGSGGFGAYVLFAERAAESLINKVGKQSDAATLSEFKDIVSGIGPGLRNGLKNALNAWRTEQPQLQHQLGEEVTGKFGSLRKYIPGKVGRAVRMLGYTRLMLVDEFTQTLVANMEVGAQARRLAIGRGIKSGTKEMNAAIQDMVEDTESEAWQKALEVARRVTFQQRGAPTTRKLKEAARAKQKVPGGRWILPFTETPLNIIETGLATSPLGIFNLASKWQQARKTGNYKGITKRSAQQLLAWSGLMLLMLLNDDDDPWITGAKGEKQYDSVRSRVAPPQSIKLGDQWYSYSRIEPFATGLSLTIDIMNALKSGSPRRMVSDPLESSYRILSNKSYLKGLGDIAKIGEYGVIEGGAKWASNFSASWVPNIVRHGVKNTTDTLPERRVWGQADSEFLRVAAKRAAQKTEIPQLFGVLQDVPKYDVWGETLKRNTSPVPMTDFVFRMVAPTQTKTAEPFIGDRVLMRWNMLHPDDEKNPSLPAKFFTVNGKKKHLSEDEYGEYLRLSGQIAKKRLLLLNLNADRPTERDVKLIEDTLSASRKLAKQHVLAGKTDIDTGEAAAELHKTTIGKELYSASGPGSTENSEKQAMKSADFVKSLDLKPDDAVKQLEQHMLSDLNERRRKKGAKSDLKKMPFGVRKYKTTVDTYKERRKRLLERIQ